MTVFLAIGLGLATGCVESPTTQQEPTRYGMTLDELLLQNARTCNSGFEYPQTLVDGLGKQLVEELICMDSNILAFYTPCELSGCINDDGPQPLAMRPEVISALEETATALDDFISITAGYRDVAMQYYSRWYKENCNSNFAAAVPGGSNHQGGRAIDVRYYDFWWDALLEHGFEHRIPGDAPHFEFLGDETFRQESDDLKVLSITAFQRLWNRNNPGDTVAESGIYDATTKEALGNSPVEGFELSGCSPDVADPDPDADMGVADSGQQDTEVDAGSDAPDNTTNPQDAGSDTSTSDDTSGDDVSGDDTGAGGVDTTVSNPADSGGTALPDTGMSVGTGPNTTGGAPDPANENPVPRFAQVGENGLGDEGCGVSASPTRAPNVGLFAGLGLAAFVVRRRKGGQRHVGHATK